MTYNNNYLTHIYICNKMDENLICANSHTQSVHYVEIIRRGN